MQLRWDNYVNVGYDVCVQSDYLGDYNGWVTVESDLPGGGPITITTRLSVLLTRNGSWLTWTNDFINPTTPVYMVTPWATALQPASYCAVFRQHDVYGWYIIDKECATF
jgi:hypothetical protein